MAQHPSQGEDPQEAPGTIVICLHITARSTITLGLDNGEIWLFDANGEGKTILRGHEKPVWALASTENYLFSGGGDSEVIVWDIDEGKIIRILRGHTETIRCLKTSEPNKIISGSRDGMLRIWNMSSGICEKVLEGHTDTVRCLELNDTSTRMISGSNDGTARIWDISSGEQVHLFSGHTGAIFKAAIDAERSYTASLDGTARVWDNATGECLAILSGHTGPVSFLRIHNGSLVTAGPDGAIKLWSLSTLTLGTSIPAHDVAVRSLDIQGPWIISADMDTEGRVKIWDAETGALVREIGEPRVVFQVALDGEKAIVAARQGDSPVVEVWPLIQAD